ncbi:MAG: hypothetical protein H7256_03410 [Bdellovibrio sp.]|nr:hypothetical protein [Bdellovibrio sp.]
MKKSNLFSFHIYSGLALTLFLTACNLPTPKEKDGAISEDASTFTAEAAAGRSTALEATNEGAFSLPTAKTFNFFACLKDVAYSRPIVGHKFIIAETKSEVTSDASGCLVWSEKIEYNYLADSQYVRIDRHIVATGLHKGTRTISFAVNPWSHGENVAAIVDLKKGSVIPHFIDSTELSLNALKGISKYGALRSRPLWIEDARLTVSTKKLTQQGQDLSFEFQSVPSIQLTKMNDEIVSRPLTAGSFKIRLSLIHTYSENDQEVNRLLAKSSLLDAKIENGSLSVKANITLPVLPTRGRIVLGVALQPVDGPKGLTSFEGLFNLGESDQMNGILPLKVSASVAQKKDFKINDFVNAQYSDLALDMNKSGQTSDIYQKRKIEVSPLSFTYVRVGHETTASSEIVYSIKACFKNALDQKSMRAQVFKVTQFQQASAGKLAATLDVQANNSGCINWDETIEFKPFECPRYIKGSVQIQNADLGMNEKLDMIVNPWEPQNSLARDLREVDAKENLVFDCKTENRAGTQVLFDSYSVSALSYNYEIDRFLNLKLIKKIQFKSDPRLLQWSNLSNGRTETKKMRDGIYLLKLAIIHNKDYDQNNTYVSSAEKLINIVNGQINTDMTFKIDDFKELGNRNTLLVQLYPVDEKKVSAVGQNLILKTAGSLATAIDTTANLESNTFMGPITLNVDEFSRPLRAMDASLAGQFFVQGLINSPTANKEIVNQVIAQGTKDKLAKAKVMELRATAPQMALENNLDLIQLNRVAAKDSLAGLLKLIAKASGAPITKADLQNVISTGKINPNLARELCSFWITQYLPSMYAAQGGGLSKRSMQSFRADCLQAVSENPSYFIKLENRYLVQDVGGSTHVKGYNQDVGVGTEFSLSQTHSRSETKSFGAGVKAGIQVPVIDIFSVGAEAGASISTSNTEATSSGIAVQTYTTLRVQQNLEKVRINKYEKCAVLNLNPTLFIKDTKSLFIADDFLSVLNSKLSDAELASVVSRGIMICEGQVRTAPLDIYEQYFLISQETSSTQMQDSGDERNRNFFLTLRSANEYARFLAATQSRIKMPEGKESQFEASSQRYFLESLFKLSGPTYPGMYLAP